MIDSQSVDITAKSRHRTGGGVGRKKMGKIIVVGVGGSSRVGKVVHLVDCFCGPVVGGEIRLGVGSIDRACG